MEWNSVSDMLKSVTTSVLKLGGCLMLLAAVAGDLASVFGLAIGLSLSLMQLFMLSGAMQRAVHLNATKAQILAAGSYLVRYALTIVALGFCFFNPLINFYAAIFGVLSVKIVIVGSAVVTAVRAGGTAYLRHLATSLRQGKEG